MTGISALFAGAMHLIGGVLIPAVVGLVLIGALFWLGLSWFHRGRGAASGDDGRWMEEHYERPW